MLKFNVVHRLNIIVIVIVKISCIFATDKNNKKIEIMTRAIKNKQTNKVEFFRNGKQVFDFTIKGNIVTFSNGDYILL